MKRILLSLFVFAGCPPTPTPGPGPGPTVATCATSCARAALLGCTWAKPTAKGLTCTQVCLNLNATGFTSFNVACRTAATSCAAADLCERGQ